MADNDDLADLVPPSPVASSTQMSQSRVGQPRLPRLPSLDINLDIDGGVSLSPIATDDEGEGQRVFAHRGRNRTFARSTGASGSNLRDWVLRSTQEPIHIPSEHGLQAQNEEFVEVVDPNDDDSSRNSSITIVDDSSSDNEVLLVSDSDGEIQSRASTANDDEEGDVHDDNDDTLMNRPVEADQAGAQPPVIEESDDAPGPSDPPDMVDAVQGEGSNPPAGANNVQPAQGTAGSTAMDQPGDIAGSIDALPSGIADLPTGISSTPGPSVRLIAGQGESPADFRSPKRKRVHSPEHSSAAAAEDKKADDEEEDGDSCPICFEAWTTSGLHRLCSLKCGHLFGQSCIEKWLKGQGGKCPHCNAKAKRHDIRVLYAKSIKAMDTSERDRALKDLEKEREVRKRAEMEGAQVRLQYQMAIEENNRLQLELQSLKNQLRRSGGTGALEAVASGSRNPSGVLGMNQSKIAGQFVLDKTIKICQAGNCRVIAYCAPLAALVASAPSSNPLFPGFGVKMINTLDVGNTQFFTIHSKPIRDLSFHPSIDDGMLLSCSLDKKVKMTSLLSGAIVQTYETPMAAWSCVWNAENSNLFYAGLQNGEILEFDVRNTEGAVRTLSGDKRSPVASLCYLSQDMNAEFRSGGLLVGQLDRVSFFENLPNHQHRIHILPLEGSLTSLQIEPSTRHILASFRPTGNHPTVRHQLCKLVSRNISGDPTVIDNVCSCTVIHTFHGGRTQTVLSRNSVMPHPADHSRLLVCGGDELNKSVHVWDSATGQMSQRLVTGDFTLDLCSYRMNNITYLAALSDKNCRLFKFT